MKYAWLLVILLGSIAVIAQETAPAVPEPGTSAKQDTLEIVQAGPGPDAGPMQKRTIVMHRRGGDKVFFHSEFNSGRWWKDSELVKQVGVSDAQVQQMEKIFQDSRIPLIDAKAELERQEARLEPLMDAQNPDEKQLAAQIDKVAMARAGLEKAHAMMLVNMRRVLTADQWKKLQALQPQHGPMKVTVPLPPMPPMGPMGPEHISKRHVR